ncbi:MAG: malto-oligosyltrehalose trehalohydrolase [Terriglobales bacterium]
MRERVRVWAPAAAQVDLETGGRRTAMVKQNGGWWEAREPLADAADYAFCLNGGPPRPDPCSRWQPHGIHGASRRFDAQSYAWRDRGWQPPPWHDAVVYELHIGTFSDEGTFEGAIQHLDHLTDLGITHVELMPVAEFPGRRGWGYDGVDLYAPHHAYGGPGGLQRFVDACHARGLAVIFDVVYNHLGPVGNYLAQFGPYFTDRCHTPWGAAVNLDGPGSDEVRAFFMDNARSWLRDFHADGLRLDAVHALLDRSATPFLLDLARAVRELEGELRRPLVVITESDSNDSRLTAPEPVNGIGLTASWNEDFHHAVHARLTGEHFGYFQDFANPETLPTVLRRGYWLDGRHSNFRRCRHGRPADPAHGERLVAYVQNHDQVGNRAGGERLGALVPEREAKLAAELLLRSPFVPLLFQGEEWGASTPFLYFTDFDEPELARTVREGRARECVAMGWPGACFDPQDSATFERSRLRWDEIEKPQHAATLAWYREQIHARRARAPVNHDLGSARARQLWEPLLDRG